MLLKVTYNKINSVLIKILKEGFISSIKKIMNLFQEVFKSKIFKIEKFVIAEKLLTGDEKIIPPKINCSFEPITLKNLSLFTDQVGNEKILVFKNRIRKKDIGIAVFSDEKLAGYSWALFNDEKNGIGLQIPLLKDNIILKDGYVIPEFRKNGLQTYMKSILINIANEKKMKIVYAAFYEWNLYSRKAYLKNNFLETKKVYLISLFKGKYQIERKIKDEEKIENISD